jgi:hypothetical protein
MGLRPCYRLRYDRASETAEHRVGYPKTGTRAPHAEPELAAAIVLDRGCAAATGRTVCSVASWPRPTRPTCWPRWQRSALTWRMRPSGWRLAGVLRLMIKYTDLPMSVHPIMAA